MKEALRRIVKKISGTERAGRLGKKGKGSYHPSGSSSRKKESARKLKGKLMKKYEGRDVGQVLGAKEISNDFGSVLYLEEDYPVNWWSLQDPCGQIMSDLKLVYGIGPVTEGELKEEGYSSIEDLAGHPEWSDQVEGLMSDIDFSSPSEAKSLISRWKPASHPLHLSLAGLFDRKDFAILDIETLGLTHQPIILFAVAVPGQEKTKVYQLLLKDVSQEPAALLEFSKMVENKGAYITYNGKRFDIPYINRRFNFYGLKNDMDGMHFDLYQFVRNEWGGQIPDCSLNTVEKNKLGIRRDRDVPSELVPEFYSTYQSTGNPGPLLPLLEHNRQDVLSLQSVFCSLGTKLEEGNGGNKEST